MVCLNEEDESDEGMDESMVDRTIPPTATASSSRYELFIRSNACSPIELEPNASGYFDSLYSVMSSKNPGDKKMESKYSGELVRGGVSKDQADTAAKWFQCTVSWKVGG